MRLSIEELLEHCRLTCKGIEKTAKEFKKGIESKSYFEHFSVALYLEELLSFRATGLTPAQMVEIDRMYQEKCEEVAALKKETRSEWIFCMDDLPKEENEYLVLIGFPGSDYCRCLARYSLARDSWDIKAPVVAWQPLAPLPAKELIDEKL